MPHPRSFIILPLFSGIVVVVLVVMVAPCWGGCGCEGGLGSSSEQNRDKYCPEI